MRRGKMAPRWEIQGGTLFLVDENDVARVPSTNEIYESLVERRPSAAWIPTSLDGLRASRYPLEPTLSISIGRDDKTPYCAITSNVRGYQLGLSLEDLVRGHIVSEGVWYPIEPTASSEILTLIQGASISIGNIKSLKSLLSIRKAAQSGYPITDDTTHVVLSPLAFTPAGAESPTNVKATLYPYQLSGWRWLKFLLAEKVGGVLADEMGLGKTLQVISILSDPGGTQLTPTLIVAPGSLLENWRREFAKFAPHLNILKHHGALRTGRPMELSNYDVVITSYDNAVRDNGLLNMVAWKVVVLDEAQYIRNPEAQRTRSVKRLRREVGLAMTGTPVENRLLDLWSIVDFVMPGYLGDAKSFAADFDNDIDSARRLEPLVSPLMLRRRVAEVAKDLPERVDIPQIIELDASEAQAYEDERQRIYSEYGAAATLVALTSLRRFCAHPSLIDGGGITSDPMSFSKFRRLDEIVDEIFSRGEKVIIFTSFTAMADVIAHHIRTRFGAFVGVIDGRLPIDERQPLIDQFGLFQGGAALVLNPKAGGTGLNITAANHVIHYNLEWNPALEDQASARAYRRGQILPVTVHRLVVADTVEDVVDARLSRKRAIAGTAVVGLEGRDEDYADLVAALTRSPMKTAGQ